MVANPHYNPDWEKIHDFHDVKRRAASELMNSSKGETWLDAKSEFDKHHQACLNTFKMSHKTIEDYATWVFQTFDVSRGAKDAITAIKSFDFSKFKTVEEVDKAWSQASDRIQADIYAQQGRLETGQPDGLEAFSGHGSIETVQYWRHFSYDDLYPNAPGCSYGFSGVTTLITADHRADGWHFCLSQDNQGGSVVNNIERIASTIVREWTDIEDKLKPLFIRVLPKFLKKDRMPGLHFYQHVMPENGFRESFGPVELDYQNQKFTNPRWQHYSTIPKLVQDARFNCAAQQIDPEPLLITH